MRVKTVGIIGLGLIGGSIAKALRFRLGIKDIIAADRDESSLKSATEDGIISCGINNIDEHFAGCDVIFICTPVKSAIEHLKYLSEIIKPDCIVTDVCSTKAEIVDYADNNSLNIRFIGGHPMAGSEKAGYTASSDHMFENAYYVLCPSKNAGIESINLLSGILTGIGAVPVIMKPEEHDRVTGSISHLPHIAASALVNLVRKTDSEDSKMKTLAAGGFRDITRIASSNPGMWENIILSNKEQLLSILNMYISDLEDFKSQLINIDSAGILEFFQSSKNYRDTLSSSKTGLFPAIYEIIADIEDKPGIIGEIATLLGKSNINIKNINISNSREFEQGCLRITLPDEESAEASMKLLKEAGYQVFKCC